MESYDDITTKHMRTVKEMGILEGELDITQQDLKEISTELGMTEEGWQLVLRASREKLVLSESHFKHKSYRECILSAEDAQMLDPFIKGARGIKAKAFLLMAINENDNSYLVKAEKQARVTLEKESNDSNAIEVMATLSSKKRILKDSTEKKTNKSVLYIVAALLLIGGISWFLFMGSPQANAATEKIENVEKQLESGYEKQLVLIPKVEGLLGGSDEDQESKEALDDLKDLLKNGELTVKEKYELNIELSEELSSVVYRKSSEEDSPLLNDLRVLIEGAQNRINIERKNYNDALTEFNNSGSKKLPKL